MSVFFSFLACPGSRNIIVGSGVINSPHYPSNYPNNAECVWYITAPAGYKIKLSFLAFSVSCYCKDAVKLYDGQGMNTKLLGKYCGSSKPVPMFSSGRYMLVRFVSDSSTVDSGFEARYESVPNDQGMISSFQS